MPTKHMCKVRPSLSGSVREWDVRNLRLGPLLFLPSAAFAQTTRETEERHHRTNATAFSHPKKEKKKRSPRSAIHFVESEMNNSR